MKSRSTLIITFFAVTVAFASIGVAGFFAYRYHDLQTKQADFELTQLIERIGKLAELPAGQPTLATVSDVEKLADQPVFAESANGDKVLLYADTGKAYVYRPSTQKLVAIGIVNAPKTATEKSPEASTSPLVSPVATPKASAKL